MIGYDHEFYMIGYNHEFYSGYTGDEYSFHLHHDGDDYVFQNLRSTESRSTTKT